MTWLPDGHATVHPADHPEMIGEAMQLRPDLVEDFLTWSGGGDLLINGGPAVLLPGNGPITQRLVGLGDFAVRFDGRVRAERADGFWQRFTLADQPDGG